MRNGYFVLYLFVLLSSCLELRSQCNNVVINGDASDGFNHWYYVSSGTGNSWITEPWEYGQAFVSSYEWSSMDYIVDLVGAGYTEEFLDSIQPTISYFQMYRGHYNNYEDSAIWRVRLLDSTYAAMESHYYGNPSVPLLTYNGWDTIQGDFESYGPGLRYVLVHMEGRDSEYWGGNYGAIFDNTIVSVAEVIDTTICPGESVFFDGQSRTQTGIYYATYSGVYGCDSVVELRLEVDEFSADAILDSNTSCHGSADGGASAIYTGSVGGVSFSWNTGSNDSSITSLSAGTYSVTISSGSGCTDSASVVVSEPNELSATVYTAPTISGFSKVGETDSTFVYYNSSAMPYNSARQLALSSGGDMIVIKDASHQAYYSSILPQQSWIGLSDEDEEGAFYWVDGTELVYENWESGEPSNTGGVEHNVHFSTGYEWNDFPGYQSKTFGMVIYKSSLNPSNVFCYGGNEGAAVIHASGGTQPYSYFWDNSATTDSITALSAGYYLCTVTDFNGCTEVDTAVISEPKELQFELDSIDVLCAGDSSGSAFVFVYPHTGTLPYSYLWSNGDTLDSLSSVPAGIYTVTVTDANGCTISDSVTINEPPELILSPILDSNVSCAGLSDGGASASYVGGTGSVTFTWNTGSIDSSVTSLSAGTYGITVQDQFGCFDTGNVIISEPDSLETIAFLDSIATCYNASDGGVSANSTGGTTPYSYEWNNLSVDSILSGIPFGLYEVTVTDANGCTDSANVFVDFFDDIAPTPIAQSITIYLDEFGTAQIDVLDIDNGSFDNCGLDTLFIDKNEFECDDIGIDSIEFSVIDSNLNLSTIMVPVTIVDTFAPIIQCQSDTAICTEVFNYPMPTALDNCSGYSIFQIDGLASGSVFPVGITTNTFVVTDSGGNTDTCSFTVTRDENSIPADAGLDTALCNLTSINLNATVPLSGNGSWNSLGSATVVSEFQNNTQVNGLIIGNNDFVWTVSNGTCPPTSDTVTIRIDANPSPSEAGTDATFCDQFDFDFDLNANVPLIGNGVWSTSTTSIIDDSTSETSMVSNLSVGENLFIWQIENGVCPPSVDSVLISIGTAPVIDAGPDIYLEGPADIDLNVTLTPPTTNISSILWEPSDLVTESDKAATSAFIEENTEFIVTATSHPFCVSKDTVVVQINIPEEIKTVITPNGDNINDVWDIAGSANYPQMKVYVFNRWGAQVFESDAGYNSKFDGTYKGNLLPVSSYYYVIEFNDGLRDPIDGNLTIIY